MRLFSLVTLIGAAPAWAGPQSHNTTLPVPPAIATAHKNDPLVFAGYLDATLYGADPTGQRDSTAAIQAAMNDARDYAMASYLPPGTYLVSDTLHGLEHFDANSCFPWGQAPSLVGPANGPRPRIVLQNASAGFGNASSPKPVVHFINDGRESNGTLGPEYQVFPIDGQAGAFDCLMNAVIRDVDIVLGNNPGAVGIWFYSAQLSYMENVSIDATGGFAGIGGAPATDTWVNLSVTGGHYGVRIDDGACGSSSIAGLVLRNQLVAGLYTEGSCGATVVSGFDIEEPAAVGVEAGWAWGPQTATLTLIDGNIVAGNGGTAIDNPRNINLYVDDVYAQTTGALVRTAGAQTVAGTGHVELIRVYAHADPGHEAATNGVPFAAVNVVDGVSTSNDVVNVLPDAGTPPSDLASRHLPGTLPWVDDGDVVYATDFGADPTGASDSTAAIQQAIDSSPGVFLPRGSYVISGTLQLKPDTRLFGVPLRSSISAPDWNPNGQFKPFIRTADSATGHTYVGDLQLWLDAYASNSPSADPKYGYGATYLSAVEWQVGRESVLNQVIPGVAWVQGPDYSSAPRSLVHVLNHGGGKMYGLDQMYSNQNRLQGALLLLVDHTHEPLTLYGPNPEHAFDYYKITGASNVRILSIKTESRGHLITIDNSSNVMVAGLNGDYSIQYGADFALTGSSNIVLAGLAYYARDNSMSPLISDGTNSWSGANAYGVFSEGTFDDGAFPFCGDAVCGGAETAANCSADCSGAGPDAGTSSSDAGIESMRRTLSACHAVSLDGSDAFWANVAPLRLPHTAALTLSDAPELPSSDSDLSASLKLAWSDSGLIVLVDVTDEVVVDDGAMAVYEEDGVELYLDGTHSRSASYDAHDFQLIVTAQGRVDPAFGGATGFARSVRPTADGYQVQLTVPWAALGTHYGVIGFDLAVNDKDQAQVMRQSQLMWSGSGIAYQDPRDFGDLVLDDRPCGAHDDLPDAGVTTAVDGGASSGAGAAGGDGDRVGVCGCSTGVDGCLLLALAVLLRRQSRARHRRVEWGPRLHRVVLSWRQPAKSPQSIASRT